MFVIYMSAEAEPLEGPGGACSAGTHRAEILLHWFSCAGMMRLLKVLNILIHTVNATQITITMKTLIYEVTLPDKRHPQIETEERAGGC